MESSVHAYRHRHGQPTTVHGMSGRTPEEGGGGIRKRADGQNTTRGTVWMMHITGFMMQCSDNMLKKMELIYICSIFNHILGKNNVRSLVNPLDCQDTLINVVNIRYLHF